MKRREEKPLETIKITRGPGMNEWIKPKNQSPRRNEPPKWEEEEKWEEKREDEE